jgi:hypothetical protein
MECTHVYSVSCSNLTLTACVTSVTTLFVQTQGNVEMVAFLIEQSAEWPEQLWQRDTATDDPYGTVSCWALPALQYAIAADCELPVKIHHILASVTLQHHM